MHFALPPRKTSKPAPYHGSRAPTGFPIPRIRKRSLGILVAIILLISLFFVFPRKEVVVVEVIPEGTPEIVIVTVFHNAQKKGFADMVIANRLTYAEKYSEKIKSLNVSQKLTRFRIRLLRCQFDRL